MPRRAAAALVVGAALAASVSCSGPAGAPAVSARMDFVRAELYDAPVPDESLRTASGGVDLSKLPNADASIFVTDARDIVTREARGFPQTSTSFFQMTGALDPASLPAAPESVRTDAAVQIVDVDGASPELAARTPALVTFLADAGPYGAQNLLGVTPYQGRPLRAGTLYAVVLTTALRDASGRAVAPSPQMSAILSGKQPAGMPDAAFGAYRAAVDALAHAGVDRATLAAMNVFRTDDWAPSYQAVLADAMGRPAWSAPLAPKETFASFCVYEGAIDMPVYQRGAPPYAKTGGDWAFDGAGKPVLQRMERAGVVVTVPRAPMPAGGYPTVVFARTGAGGDRPLVDRGVQGTTGGPPLAPGTGPALELGRVGFAAISIDGPLEGLRNPTGEDEDFLIFNISNPIAIRDNVRQSAIELDLAAHVLDGLTVDATACPGAQTKASFDTGKLALFSHSMGSTISPLALAFEPRFGAAILSGAGGSWIENVLYKTKPVAVRPLAEILVGYPQQHRQLVLGDPALALVQWAAEAADPPLYGDRVVAPLGAGRARHVLMVQGIVDHYIEPPMANTVSLSFGLDRAGPALDEGNAELAGFDPLGRVLSYSGRRAIALPASANRAHPDGSASTAVVVQWPADGVEDGHEVIYQRPEPKYQYRCFLKGFGAGGVPVVPEGQASDAVCP